MTKRPKFASKDAMIRKIGEALECKSGLAIGKLGGSEQTALLFHMACLDNGSKDLLSPVNRPIYLAFRYHCEHQTGIFPTDPQFLINYADFYTSQIRQTDYLGLFGRPTESRIIERLELPAEFLRYTDTEPDRSIPYDSSRCYLPLFRGHRILLVAPFASFAKSRAEKDIFESVWQKIDGQWFYPESVDAIDIPYSYVGQQNTFSTHESSLDLYQHITEKMDQHDYDVALIAAGSLAIPLAAHAKSKGKVGVSMGGHFQALFGIIGDRWANNPVWQKSYINDTWSRLPERFIPKNAHLLTDNKSYW